MAKTNKKLEILEQARSLFYTEGYNDASMSMIAEACGIRKQSISRHYGSKANLALHVYESISDDFLQVFRGKTKSLGISDTVIADAASAMWIPRYYLADQNAHRFYDEFVYGCISDIENIRYEESRHHRLAVRYPEGLPVEMMEADYISSRYAAKGILYHYCRGELKMKLEEFEDYYYQTAYRPFIRDEEELKEIGKVAKYVLKQIEITIKPNFVIE